MFKEVLCLRVTKKPAVKAGLNDTINLKHRVMNE